MTPKNEENLKKHCEAIAFAMEGMMAAIVIEILDEKNKPVHAKAVKIRKKAHKVITGLLINIAKFASDSNFDLKKIDTEEKFKFLDLKED